MNICYYNLGHTDELFINRAIRWEGIFIRENSKSIGKILLYTSIFLSISGVEPETFD